MLETDNFGPVVQCEIGALVVGGITNPNSNTRFMKGQEKGNFDLAGSTIVLLFEEGKVDIIPEFKDKLNSESEVRVLQGQWVGSALAAK